VKSVVKRGLWAGVLAAGVAAFAAIAITGSASAERAQAAKTVKLKMAVKGEKLDFFGPNKVEKGDKLEVVNKTAVDEVGPHTFTLIDPKLMDSREEREKCEQVQGKVCPAIFEAHQVGPPPEFEVGKRNVDVGKNGWDREFTRRKKGDSWYTDELGATETRKVSAKAGDEIGYFCLVHPFMRGTLKVK
jgi:hypothetical protein